MLADKYHVDPKLALDEEHWPEYLVSTLLEVTSAEHEGKDKHQKREERKNQVRKMNQKR